MKLAICDDEKISRDEICSLINDYRIRKKIDIFPDVYDSGYKLLASKLNYDVILMDYQMNEIDGIETCRKIREENKDCVIIFISAYPLIAVDSFEVGTFRFITKPINKDKLFKALDDYLAKIDDDSILPLKTQDGSWILKLSEIIYAEANGKHTIIRTSNHSYDIHTHLKDIEDQLPTDKFMRCHRAFIAGFNHIKNHNNDVILFDNGEKAEIGKHYLKQFKSTFQDYIIRYNKDIEV